ncbi:MAG: CAAX protease [Vulcanimicrobiaceae bacterium]
MTEQTLAPGLWTFLGGVLRLHGDAFVQSVHLRNAPVGALLVVLGAGLSEAISQGVILFANQVKPARFIFSLLINAVLFAFGYLFLVLSTWAITLFPYAAHASLGILALIFALSYAPLLFSFFGALPYLGGVITWGLRVWHLLTMVVGFSAVVHVSDFSALSYVGLGWLVMAVATHSFGRPIAALGARVVDAVAGVQLVSNEEQLIEQAERGVIPGGATSESASPPVVLEPSQGHPGRWKALVGLVLIALLTFAITLALRPAHGALFGWYEHIPRVARVPFDLFWIGIIAVTVAGFLAPLETLGWWAGWYGDEIDTTAGIEAVGGDRDGGSVSRYIVYLDGISQSSSKYTPDIETFLDALAPELPGHMRLLRGIMAYSAINRPLDDDPIFAGFWKFIDAIRFKHTASLLGMIINLRNVLVVAVSADQRYGPMYNFCIAQVVYNSLVANGYPRNSGIPVTLIGYSGGGQMSAGSASFLKRALDAPVDVISLGGVISGDCRILDLEHLYHLVGEKDGIERLGPIMFPTRWKIAVFSRWNRAKRLGRISMVPLGPVGHQVPGGMLDPDARLPDGRTFLRQTLDDITSILHGRLETADTGLVVKPANYKRYVKAPWNRPDYYPLDGAVDPEIYRPIGEWMGRLILPDREERSSVRGAWFEVHHAAEAYRHLIGRTVKLQWRRDPIVQNMVRAVTRDVHFSPQADYSSRFGGLIQPVRLNHWKLVDPLESLAGARPLDDVVVLLSGHVEVHDGDDPILRISREPVQITGRYYGLLRFDEVLDDNAERFNVTHFDRTTRDFTGKREVVRLPRAVTDTDDRYPSVTAGLERSPLNPDGWYAYGAPDERGEFVVQALAPRALLQSVPRREFSGSRAAYRYVRKEAWADIVARKGTASSACSSPSQWCVGDRALLVHVYGGITGKQREGATAMPIYFGHFAYGVAEIVHDPLADEPRFEIAYHQVYTHNTDGLIAGTLHWSRYMGDRQFGWMGTRPVCDILLRCEPFSRDFVLDGGRRTSALRAMLSQLEVMTARYRIGDGTGATYAGAANNCSQDSNRALFATLRNLQHFVENHPNYATWSKESPRERERYTALVRLAKDLKRKLQFFGTPRHDWSSNEFNLGTTLEDAPLQNILTALGSWRVILPRLASDTIVGTFLRNGADVWVLNTDQIGGEHPEIAPKAPTTL